MPDFSKVSAERLREIIVGAKSLESFRAFIRNAWDLIEPSMPFIPAWHIDAIADHLTAVTEGQIRKLLILMPPGHAKSMTVSVLWPCWVWTRQPGWRSIYAA